LYNYEPLDSMYPEVYYRVYPYVKQMCEMYDNSSNPDLNYCHTFHTSVSHMDIPDNKPQGT